MFMAKYKFYTTPIINGLTATGASQAIECRDFDEVVFTVIGEGLADGLIKFQACSVDSFPDFSAAASTSNIWDYVQTLNQNNGAAINGDTGLSFSGTAAIEQIKWNVAGASYVGVKIDTYNSGTFTVYITLVNYN